MTVTIFVGTFYNDAFQKLAVLFLQILDSGALVGGMLQVLLEELKPSPIFFDEFAPRLYADDMSRPPRNQAALAIRTTLHLMLCEVVVGVGDQPEVPAHTLDGRKPFV